MSSNLSLSLANSKNTQNPSQSSSPILAQSSSSTAADHTQRKGSNPRNSGAGAYSRSNSAAAKGNQSLRKQHKGSRRPQLMDDDAFAESAVMQSTSSRKGQTSITHLMSFSLPPRPQTHQTPHYNRNNRRNPTWGLGSGYHAADKARYIHANYRFIVDPNGDYAAQMADADVHLDWSTVLQILVSAVSQSTNCPICLSTPVVPRMARCGHIFCLPCLIRYMHSTDHVNPTPEKRARWKKCPICWDSIYISEARPVRWFTGQESERPQEGEDIVLRLVKRQPASTLALPRDGAEVFEKDQSVPFYFAAEVMDYARIMKGSEDYMIEQFDAEAEQLRELEREDELLYGDDTQWTRKAVTSVHEAKERVAGIGNAPNVSPNPVGRQSRRPPTEMKDKNDQAPTFYDIQQSIKSGQSASNSPAPSHKDRSRSVNQRLQSDSPSTSNSDPRFISLSTQARPSSKSSFPLHAAYSLSQATRNDSPFFFYEALLHYYLSSLDIRILKAAFGDYSSFPSTILPRVEHVSTGHIVDDELRKRAKYLAHLPHGCEVAFLECNWTDVVSPTILQNFASEIDRRRKKNREKEVREEKERARAEKEEDDKRWAAARRRRSNLPDAMIAREEVPTLLESHSMDLGEASSSPPWPSTRSQIGSAFATLASPSTSPANAKTVWGTPAIATLQGELPAEVPKAEPSENDGWLANWEQDLLQDDIFDAHQEQLLMEPSSSKLVNGSNKRKKGKKITLMTTNARRAA